MTLYHLIFETLTPNFNCQLNLTFTCAWNLYEKKGKTAVSFLISRANFCPTKTESGKKKPLTTRAAFPLSIIPPDYPERLLYQSDMSIVEII